MKKNLIRAGIVIALLMPLSAAGVVITRSVQFQGSLTITGALSKSSGTFAIDHPLDPKNKILFHSFVESPDAKNMYNGVAKLDKNGEVVIVLPDYYDALNGDSRYQFFALDEAMPDLYVKTEEKDNKFTISGGVPGGSISWQITGIRHDPYILLHPIPITVTKSPTTEVPQGKCIFEPLCE